MRKFFLGFLLLFSSHLVFSNPGPVFRYKVEVELEDSKTYEGYIYPVAVMGAPIYDKNERDFLDYFNEIHVPNTLKLYQEIITHKINDYIELDFTSSKQKVEFLKKNILRLELLETFEYQVGSRIQEIEDSIYVDLNFKNANYTISYNESYIENCYIILASELESLKLKEHQAKLEYGLKEALKIQPTKSNLAHEVNQYIENESECLKQKKVLLLLYCDAL